MVMMVESFIGALSLSAPAANRKSRNDIGSRLSADALSSLTSGLTIWHPRGGRHPAHQTD